MNTNRSGFSKSAKPELAGCVGARSETVAADSLEVTIRGSVEARSETVAADSLEVTIRGSAAFAQLRKKIN